MHFTAVICQVVLGSFLGNGQELMNECNTEKLHYVWGQRDSTVSKALYITSPSSIPDTDMVYLISPGLIPDHRASCMCTSPTQRPKIASLTEFST